MEKVQINYLCPMIAMISAGKTSILKVIFNIDFLEASSGIGTKFVNIIRYNPSVGKNPRFYHLILKENGNENYDYYKDIKSEVVGKEAIKAKNIEINQKLKEKDVPYTELFYMIEIGETFFIKDLEYLKNYDLVDIPGVSEYRPPQETNKPSSNENENDEQKENLPEDEDAALAIGFPDLTPNPKPKNSKTSILFQSIEAEMTTYNPDDEKNYLTEIFKIIKNKMNNGIIVFSIDNYQHVENYRIIGKLQKIINKPIENFLVLLNKIDKSENVEYDLATLKAKIFENFPSANEFNFTKNIVIPCSTIQLENEAKMDTSFKHLIYFHFVNFLVNSKTDLSSSTNLTPTATPNMSFIEFLRKKLQTISKKKYLESIEKVIKSENLPKILEEIRIIIKTIKENHADDNLNLGIRADEFEIEDIKKIPENIKGDDDDSDKEEEEDNDFNIDNQKGNSIILYFYSEFKKGKSIPPKSKETTDIMNFFTMKNTKRNLSEILNKIAEDLKQKQSKDRTLNERIDNYSQKIMKFYEEYEESNIKPENLDKLREHIRSSVGILKTSKLLYIPMLGVSNAGKSTILNGLVGCSLLPAHKNECTKKGILIRYSNINKPIIRKTRFIKEKITDKKDKESENEEDFIYYFEPEERIIAQGIDDVHQILEGSNGKFIDNEEDFFYEIDIKIKFVDDLKLDENLKEKICFIDLPGFGTNNKFETEGTYAHLLKSCNIFLFVVFNLKIKENDNQRMLDNLYKKMKKFRGLTINTFINKCLFIVNCDKNQDTSEKSLIQAKNDIIQAIEGLDKKNMKDINVCFFNAKFYENYIFKLKYYNDPEFLFEFEEIEFIRVLDKFWKGIIEKVKGSSFNKYLLKQLEENVKHDIEEKYEEGKVKINENIEKIVKELLKNNSSLVFKDKEIKVIIKLISFGKENISKSNFLLKSNIDNFSKELLICIQNGKKKGDSEINENLKNCFDILDALFELDPTQKCGNFREAPKLEVIEAHADADIVEFHNGIESLLKSITNDFQSNNVVEILEKCKDSLIESLNNKKNNIVKDLKSQKWKKIQESFENTFTEKTKILREELLNCLNTCSSEVKDHYDECYNLLNKFLVNKQSPKELLFKDYVSNNLGRDNDIEKTIEDIINDILTGSKTSTNWSKKKSFWDGLKTKFSDKAFLDKVINYMIENSTLQINDFIEKTKGFVEDFKTQIFKEVNTTKDVVSGILNDIKIKEENEKRIKESKNEEERKKWEEEKKIYEENKRKWEETCKKYRDLRHELTLLRLTDN